MYDADYGTDWTTIETDEAIERAYALGVASTLGESQPGELDRLLDAVETTHDRALVQLAYDKGRNRGREAPAESGDTSSVWSDLVTDAEREPVTVTRDRDLPPAIQSLPLLDRPGDDLKRVRLPKFLLRR